MSGEIEVRAAAVISSVICGEHQSHCECDLDKGHAGPHECDPGCGGSWLIHPDGEFEVVRFPSGIPGSGRITK